MDFLAHPVVALIVLLGVLVLFHELGHYLVGRLSGIAVEVFAIGFGPPIFRIRKAHTEYRIGIIPLGGFVKFYGAVPAESVPDELRGQEYHRASWQKRALTVAAGPVANFILAVVAFAILGYVGIKHPPAIVGDIRFGSPAEKSGLAFMDQITAIDGASVQKWSDLERQIRDKAGEKVAITVQRDNQLKVIHLVPEAVEITDYAGRQKVVGRAGIALARHPSLVTVSGPDTIAARAGIRTGDRVGSVFVDGEEKVVSYWREFIAVAWHMYQQQQQSLRLKVLSSDKEESFEVMLRWPPGEVSSSRELMTMMGMRDSQLTILDAKEEIAQHLKKHDVLLELDGQVIHDLYDLRHVMENLQGPEVKIKVLRDGLEQTVEVAMKGVEVQAPQGKVTMYTMPVSMLSEMQTPPLVTEYYSNPGSALLFGIKETGRQSWEILSVLGHLLIGEVPLKALGGPILIAKVAGESAKRGWETFVSTLALISINLGLINLFPIPVLDGGQLVMIGVEAFRRRPLPESALENFQKVGFVMIMALVVLATYNDFSRFWTSMLESVVGAF